VGANSGAGRVVSSGPRRNARIDRGEDPPAGETANCRTRRSRRSGSGGNAGRRRVAEPQDGRVLGATIRRAGWVASRRRRPRVADRPKCDVQNLFRMLEYAYRLKVEYGSELVAPRRSTSVSSSWPSFSPSACSTGRGRDFIGRTGPSRTACPTCVGRSTWAESLRRPWSGPDPVPVSRPHRERGGEPNSRVDPRTRGTKRVVLGADVADDPEGVSRPPWGRRVGAGRRSGVCRPKLTIASTRTIARSMHCAGSFSMEPGRSSTRATARRFRSC